MVKLKICLPSRSFCLAEFHNGSFALIDVRYSRTAHPCGRAASYVRYPLTGVCVSADAGSHTAATAITTAPARTATRFMEPPFGSYSND